jgi:hypothetical protein
MALGRRIYYEVCYYYGSRLNLLMARWRLTTLEPKQLMEPLMERHHRLPVQLAGLCSVQLFLQNPR